MSPQGSKNTSKPEADVYVALLFVSVAALATGITFLALELGRYAWQIAP